MNRGSSRRAARWRRREGQIELQGVQHSVVLITTVRRRATFESRNVFDMPPHGEGFVGTMRVTS